MSTNLSQQNVAVKMNILDDPRFKIKPYQQMASAVTGALATSLFMTPLDVVKTRIQAQQRLLISQKCFLYCNGLMDHICPCGPEMTSTKKTVRLNGTFDGLVQISRSEGISALWSGLGPTLVSALPSTVIYFVAYEQFKEFYLKSYKSYYLNNMLAVNDQMPLFIPLLSGISARILSVTVVSPLELMRTKMQSEKLSYGELRRSMQRLVQADGIPGLWKGLKPTIYRDVPFSGIYWSCYEQLKAIFQVREPTFGFSFFAGAVSGSISAFITTPFDVIKTHQQIEFGEKVLYADKPTKSVAEGMGAAINSIYRKHGLNGLFAGLAPRILKVAPACAIMIATFEYGKAFFYNYNRNHYNNGIMVVETAHD